jgi:hypothetical protein
MCVRVVLLIEHAQRMRHTVASFAVSGSTIFFDITSQTVRFSEKVAEHKMCVLIFSTTFV